ncbi:hypothetical protein [Ramlibacter sp. WS9]|uniref:hypothetical protein n=1 Tax=Ramlibacter sp. WS9 TaxID=1882741 RepID=UPI001142D837|nr:hypothetical protein [Ramlibacter sp. WS9]ROZ63393.1 hypothetical protein EEB15_29725 [Ramlibacter sp. WS9]
MMPSFRGTMFSWARLAASSSPESSGAPTEWDVARNGEGLTYRLRRWPDLPSHDRTADVYRTLSRMSHGPVDRNWMLTHSGLQAERVDALLRLLIAAGAVEVAADPDFNQ